MTEKPLRTARKHTNLGSDNSGRTSTAIAAIIVFALGIGLTLFVIINPMNVGPFEKVKGIIMPQEEAAPAEAGGRKILYWYAPMDPTYISDTPGKSPMGMDLVPKYADEGGETSEGGVRIDPATVQNIGVLTDTVKRGDLKVEIRTVGNLDYNEDNIYWINTKYDGWLEKVYINYVGQPVRKGQALFEIYSPDLVSTQEEYLSALKYRDKMKDSGFPEAIERAEKLLEASRSRLRYWDITDEQIDQLESSGKIKKTLTVVSPVSGLVVKKMDEALEGMHAKAGMNLYKVADLSSLWVHVDIYEYQLPWITTGQEAQVEISFYPGETFTGRVLFFYPYLDEKTRTIKVCIEIPNADGRLRPEMFATVKFMPVAAQNAVLVPATAVLHSGERDIVVLDLGGGRFDPRDVKLGLEGDGMYQVLEGLEGDEKIVTSSQFLIDSESNLKEAINKMLMAKKGGEADTGAMKMTDEGSGTKQTEQGSASKGGPTQPMSKSIDDPKVIQALDQIVKAYLPIWKSLAADSVFGVKEDAEALADASSKAADMAEEDSLKHQLRELNKAASEMKADDLQSARESMKSISRALVAVFESHDIKMPKKYVIIECPMVKERWIQDSEKVSNPFLGSSMPLCGLKVGETG